MWFIRSGTRVQGPFTEDQLRSMRGRGQFSSVCQVSLDRVHWESAAQLVQLLDGPLPQWQPRQEPPPGAGTDPAKGPGGAPQVVGAWFLLDAQRQQVGPVSADEVVRRIAARQVFASTKVCKAGDSSWRRLSSVPEFAAYIPKWGRRRVYGLVAAVSLLVAGAVFAARQWMPVVSLGTARINSLDNLELLGDAVGRVELCHRVKLPNGSVIEETSGHGTAFCITSTGYMLTNRHVVEGLYADRELNIDMKDGNVIRAREDLIPIVFFKQLRYAATVVHISSRYDFAILKVERKEPCVYFSLARGDSPRTRTEVAAVGFPSVASWANEEERAKLKTRFESDIRDAVKSRKTVYLESQLLDAAFVVSVEDGRISKLDKESNGWCRITHNAKIFKGNSGGPLIDQSGKVLGINTQMLRDLDVVGKDIISDGTIYFAYSTGQFRREIQEHITEGIDWRD